MADSSRTTLSNKCRSRRVVVSVAPRSLADFLTRRAAGLCPAAAEEQRRRCGSGNRVLCMLGELNSISLLFQPSRHASASSADTVYETTLLGWCLLVLLRRRSMLRPPVQHVNRPVATVPLDSGRRRNPVLHHTHHSSCDIFSSCPFHHCAGLSLRRRRCAARGRMLFSFNHSIHSCDCLAPCPKKLLRFRSKAKKNTFSLSPLSEVQVVA